MFKKKGTKSFIKQCLLLIFFLLSYTLYIFEFDIKIKKKCVYWIENIEILDKIPPTYKKIWNIPYSHLLNKIYITGPTEINDSLGFIYAQSEKNYAEEINAFNSNYSINITVYKNMYVTCFYTVCDGETYYAHNLREWLRDCYFGGPGTNVIKRVDELVAFGHYNVYIYGHWFFDALAPLMLLPEDILYRSSILVNGNYSFVYETFDMLKIPTRNIIFLNMSQSVFAKVVYSTSPCLHLSIYGAPLKKMIKKMKDSVGLVEFPAHGFYIMNRGGVRRSMCNESFNSILNYAKEKYQGYFWKIYMDNYTKVADTIKFWNTVKFAYAPTGSNLVGVMFMQKGGVLVNYQGSVKDYGFYNVAAMNGIWFIAHSNPHTDHLKTMIVKINLENAYKCIDLGMFIIKNKNPPKKTIDFIHFRHK